MIDARGAVLETSGPIAPWDDPPSIRIAFTLEPGEYTIRATANDGRSGETKIVVVLGQSPSWSELQVK